MNRRIASLMLSTALLAGPSLAHAALPDAATLYKNPQCGCCDDYARHLEEMGVDVTIVDGADLNEIKSAAGVPYGLGACHTIEMGSYWIEGHVPWRPWRRCMSSVPMPMASVLLACRSVRLACLVRSRATGMSIGSPMASPLPS